MKEPGNEVEYPESNKMAAELSTLVSSYLDQDPEIYGAFLLKCLESRQLLRNQSWSEEFIGKVNAFMSSKDERWLGVCLLGTTLQQCDTDTFTNNCGTWIKAVLQVLQSPGNQATVVKYCVHILDEILRYAGGFPELSRELSGSTIPSAISTLLMTKIQDITAILSALSSCILHFPRPVGPFRNRIEKFVLPLFDSPFDDQRKDACLCFAILPRCGGEGGGGNKHVVNWDMQWRQILTTIHLLLDTAYESLQSAPTVSQTSSESLPFTVIPNVEPARTHTLVTRCSSLLDCLAVMIREELLKAITVPLQDTVHMLGRILSVTDNSLINVVSVELVLLKSSLPVLHTSAVELLAALVCRCGADLLPHSNIISKLLVQELTWTSCRNSRYGQQRPFRQLRCSVYTCLENWVQMTGCLPLEDIIITKLFQQIMEDTRPQSSQTKLLPASVNELHKSNRAKKRKLQEDVGQLLTGQQKVDKQANEDVTCRALRALSTILIGAGADVPIDIYKQLQVFFLKLVMQCQQSQHNSHPIPYSDGECRQALYHVLLSCLLTHPPQVPSIVHHAVRLFSLGLQDNDLKVSSFCREALTISMALIHPRVPPRGCSTAGTLSAEGTTAGTLSAEGPTAGYQTMQVSNNVPSSTPASLDQWGTVNEHTVNGLSGSNSHGTILVNNNSNVGFVHDVQIIQNQGNVEFEQEASEETLSHTAPPVATSISTYVTEETTNTSAKPVETNSNLSLETQPLCLNENEQGALPNQVLTLHESTPTDVSEEMTITMEEDSVMDLSWPLGLTSGDDISADVETEGSSGLGDQYNEVEKILQCFVDSNPDSE